MRPVVRLLRAPLPDLLGKPHIAAAGQGWYRVAHGLLLDSIGAYCLYCESPLANDTVAARRVDMTKNPFEFATGDKNIKVLVEPRIRLLGWLNIELTCSACAAGAGKPPLTLADGLEAMKAFDSASFKRIIPENTGSGATVRVGPNDAEYVFLFAILSRLRPDSADDDLATGLIRIPGDSTWVRLAFDKSTKSQVGLRDDGLVELEEADENQAWAIAPIERVWISPAENPADDVNGLLKIRARNTIASLGLNRVDPNVIGDRRVANRTEAWVAAAQALANLEACLATFCRHPAQPNGDRLWDDVLDDYHVELLADALRVAIRTTGFWMVWAKVFEPRLSSGAGVWANFTPPARAAFLYALLIQYEVDTPPERQEELIPPEPQDEDAGSVWDGDEDGGEDFPHVVHVARGIDFVLLLRGTDLSRLPPSLGGPGDAD